MRTVASRRPNPFSTRSLPAAVTRSGRVTPASSAAANGVARRSVKRATGNVFMRDPPPSGASRLAARRGGFDVVADLVLVPPEVLAEHARQLLGLRILGRGVGPRRARGQRVARH